MALSYLINWFGNTWLNAGVKLKLLEATHSPLNKRHTPSSYDVLAASAILARSLCNVHPISSNIPTLNNRHKNIYNVLEISHTVIAETSIDVFVNKPEAWEQ